MATSSILKCFYATNFSVEGCGPMLSDTAISANNYLLDERMMILSSGNDLHDWTWYFNYLDFVRVSASKNPDARASYMLNLGYIPVIYMPTCMQDLEPKLFEVLDFKKVPYAKLHKTSFTVGKIDLPGTDAWVSKMDAGEIMGIEPDKVRSIDFIRRVLLNA